MDRGANIGGNEGGGRAMNAEAMKDAIKETASGIKAAEYLIGRAYPDGDAPAGLLPALILAIAINRATTAVENIEPELSAIAETIRDASPPDTDGIERELSGIASVIQSK
jgi:hypothetical protein